MLGGAFVLGAVLIAAAVCASPHASTRTLDRLGWFILLMLVAAIVNLAIQWRMAL